jgi:hypothetical protein
VYHRLQFVIPTEAYPNFLPRSAGQGRVKFANATNFDRKSGVAEGRDLQSALMEKQNPEAIRPRRIRLCPK